uniref:Uncharacterized protein n=1 Tax=Anopheles atroparvus TaxID=41427 RepID=A0AAG5DQD3_ANOAO
MGFLKDSMDVGETIDSQHGPSPPSSAPVQANDTPKTGVSRIPRPVRSPSNTSTQSPAQSKTEKMKALKEKALNLIVEHLEEQSGKEIP